MFFSMIFLMGGILLWWWGRKKQRHPYFTHIRFLGAFPLPNGPTWGIFFIYVGVEGFIYNILPFHIITTQRVFESLISLMGGILLWWWGRRMRSYPYFKNTWFWGIFPLPNGPFYGVAFIFVGSIGLLLHILLLFGIK